MPRRLPSDGDDRCRALRLRPPVLVPLDAQQERQAVEALAGMLAGLLSCQAGSDRPSGEDTVMHELVVPDDDEAA